MATARTKKETVAGSVKPANTAVEPKVESAATKMEPVKEKRVFTDSDYVLCRSITYGGLYIGGQSGNMYEFRDYGSECEINYRDLVSLIRKGSDHIFLPRFIILDEDLLDDFPTIKRAYEVAYTRKDLLEILALPTSQMKAAISELPALESFRHIVSNVKRIHFTTFGFYRFPTFFSCKCENHPSQST